MYIFVYIGGHINREYFAMYVEEYIIFTGVSYYYCKIIVEMVLTALII